MMAMKMTLQKIMMGFLISEFIYLNETNDATETSKEQDPNKNSYTKNIL